MLVQLRKNISVGMIPLLLSAVHHRSAVNMIYTILATINQVTNTYVIYNLQSHCVVITGAYHIINYQLIHLQPAKQAHGISFNSIETLLLEVFKNCIVPKDNFMLHHARKLSLMVKQLHEVSVTIPISAVHEPFEFAMCLLFHHYFFCQH